MSTREDELFMEWAHILAEIERLRGLLIRVKQDLSRAKSEASLDKGGGEE